MMFSYPKQTELLIYLYNQREVNEPEILEQLTAIFAGNRELAERVYAKYGLSWFTRAENMVSWFEALQELFSQPENRNLRWNDLELKTKDELRKKKLHSLMTINFVRFLLTKIAVAPVPPPAEPEPEPASATVATASHQLFFDQGMALLEEWRDSMKKLERQLEDLRQENQQLRRKLTEGEQKMREADLALLREVAYQRQLAALQKDKEEARKDMLTRLLQDVEATCSGLFTQGKFEAGNLSAYGATVLNRLLDIFREEGLQLYFPVIAGKELKPGQQVTCTAEVREHTRPENGLNWNDIGAGPVELVRAGVRLGERIVYLPAVRPVKEG